MSHHHENHGHDHGPPTYNAAFAIRVALNVGFVAIEAMYRIIRHSLALATDV